MIYVINRGLGDSVVTVGPAKSVITRQQCFNSMDNACEVMWGDTSKSAQTQCRSAGYAHCDTACGAGPSGACPEGVLKMQKPRVVPRRPVVRFFSF